MLVNVVGFNLVGGKRKSDGQDWSAVNLHYNCDHVGTDKFYGIEAHSEFINSRFFNDLKQSGLGEYQLEFARGFDGKAYVSSLTKVD